MFCLSKGLAAPVGSLLVGDEDTIREARRVRKMFGGGMRQAGIIAAAGLVAFDETLPLLGEDNRRAHDLALGLAEIPGIVLNPETVETNIVFFRLEDDVRLSAADLASLLGDEGVLVHALGADSIRMVTHYHVGDEDVETAVSATRRVLGAA
jgi:threonine aldolase